MYIVLDCQNYTTAHALSKNKCMKRNNQLIAKKYVFLAIALKTIFCFSSITIDRKPILCLSKNEDTQKFCLALNGVNSYAQSSNVINNLNQFTITSWIDLSENLNHDGIIIGQKKIQLKINQSRKLQAVVNNNIYTSNSILDKSRWYHIGLMYGNNQVKFLINGEVVDAFNSLTQNIADTSMLTIGKNPETNGNYFTGKIDEVRIFNRTLDIVDYRKIIYQELDFSDNFIKGKAIPMKINSLLSSSLISYFDFNSTNENNISNKSSLNRLTNNHLSFYNIDFINQEAPMPFQTIADGNFVNAINNPSSHVRGIDVVDFSWAIINVNNNIIETSNTTNLGLTINTNATVTMTNDTKLQNTWYLKINGKLDLKDKSQLIQTINSEYDTQSTGYIERDQKGQANLYNYNYWSSPVSSSQNYLSYTIVDVMKDGTNSVPQNIQWTTGFNSLETTPITLSNYWIYKFQNLSPNYANWTFVGENGILNAGQGFTMKGSGIDNSSQNYTFVGKPNNGTITSIVGPNNLNLSGNPYPSAIDADKFIRDNIGSINGTLYFWENYQSNDTHNLSEYQGGYSTRSLVGGTASVISLEDEIEINGKTPGRFIPVGQGFFVKGSNTGGTITFKNDQRIFIKETNTASNSLLRANNSVVNPLNTNYNNQEDDFTQEVFSKLRLGYTSANNYHKQILLGFMNQYATSGIDAGYDAETIDNQPIDLYFVNSNKKLNIQGDTYFNIQSIFPIGIKTAVAGIVKFKIDDLENFDENQNIFIYDNVTNEYHSIKNETFEIEMPIGTFDNRFSLRFNGPNALNTNQNDLENGIEVTYSFNNNIISIKNHLVGTTVKDIQLYNLLGQKVADWNVEILSQTSIEVTPNEVSSGTYIIKVMTNNGVVTKKILIK